MLVWVATSPARPLSPHHGGVAVPLQFGAFPRTKGLGRNWGGGISTCVMRQTPQNIDGETKAAKGQELTLQSPRQWDSHSRAFPNPG